MAGCHECASPHNPSKGTDGRRSPPLTKRVNPEILQDWNWQCIYLQSPLRMASISETNNSPIGRCSRSRLLAIAIGLRFFLGLHRRRLAVELMWSTAGKPPDLMMDRGRATNQISILSLRFETSHRAEHCKRQLAWIWCISWFS
jgi:hypothetical protein